MTELSAGEARAAQDPLLRHDPQRQRREAPVTYRVRRRVDVGVFEEWPRPGAESTEGSAPTTTAEPGAPVPPPPPSPAGSGEGTGQPPVAPDEPEWMPGHEPNSGDGSRRRLSGGILRSALVFTMVFGVGAWGAITAADRDDESGEIVDAGSLNVEKIALGDCLEIPEDEEFNQVNAVPCSEPHEAQVYWLRQLPAGEFPGLDELHSMAETQCDASFATTLPPAIVDDLDYGYTWFTPTEAGWQAGDRVVKCLVGRVDGTTVTGSLLAS